MLEFYQQQVKWRLFFRDAARRAKNGEAGRSSFYFRGKLGHLAEENLCVCWILLDSTLFTCIGNNSVGSVRKMAYKIGIMRIDEETILDGRI